MKPPRGKSSPQRGNELTSQAILSLDNVSLHRPATDQPLFNRLNWSIHPGERWAVVGPEGCGKTTLHRLMAGLIRPDTGEILLQGVPHTALTNRSEILGVLFSEPSPRFLTPMVWEEIALTPSIQGVAGEALQQRVYQALQQAGLAKELATRELTSLSASQCARVAWAAVFAAHPQLLLADEPGAQLSLEGETELANHPPPSMASVIFTSRMGRAKRFANRYLWLENGEMTLLVKT